MVKLIRTRYSINDKVQPSSNKLLITFNDTALEVSLAMIMPSSCIGKLTLFSSQKSMNALKGELPLLVRSHSQTPAAGQAQTTDLE